MTRFTLPLAAAVALAIALPAVGLTLADLEPAKGDRIAYRVSEDTKMSFEGTPATVSAHGSGTQTIEVVATSKGGGTTAYIVLSSQEMKRTRGQNGSEETTTSYSLEVCRTSPTGLYTDANISTENGEDSSVDVGRWVLNVRLPCEPGTSWRVGRLSYKDGFTMRPESQAVAYETVEVPAGTFEKCLKVASTCPNGIEGHLEQEGQTFEIVSGELAVTSWYAPKVGLTKEVVSTTLRLRPEGQDQAAILRIDTASTTELTDYKLAQRPPK